MEGGRSGCPPLLGAGPSTFGARRDRAPKGLVEAGCAGPVLRGVGAGGRARGGCRRESRRVHRGSSGEHPSASGCGDDEARVGWRARVGWGGVVCDDRGEARGSSGGWGLSGPCRCRRTGRGRSALWCRSRWSGRGERAGEPVGGGRQVADRAAAGRRITAAATRPSQIRSGRLVGTAARRAAAGAGREVGLLRGQRGRERAGSVAEWAVAGACRVRRVVPRGTSGPLRPGWPPCSTWNRPTEPLRGAGASDSPTPRGRRAAVAPFGRPRFTESGHGTSMVPGP